METTKIITSNLMTVNDYAVLMDVTRQTVFNWVKDGRLKKVKFLGKEFIDKSTFKEVA
jgi:excisionase family DNA binding protein